MSSSTSSISSSSAREVRVFAAKSDTPQSSVRVDAILKDTNESSWLKEYNDILSRLQNTTPDTRLFSLLENRLIQNPKPRWMEPQRLSLLYEAAVNARLNDITALLKQHIQPTSGAITATLRSGSQKEGLNLIQQCDDSSALSEALRACSPQALLFIARNFQSEKSRMIDALLNCLCNNSAAQNALKIFIEQLFRSKKFVFLSSEGSLIVAKSLLTMLPEWWIKDKEVQTAFLVSAIRKRDSVTALFILQNKMVDITLKTVDGASLLAKAAENNMEDVLLFLVSKGLLPCNEDTKTIAAHCSTTTLRTMYTQLMQNASWVASENHPLLLMHLFASNKTSLAIDFLELCLKQSILPFTSSREMDGLSLLVVTLVLTTQENFTTEQKAVVKQAIVQLIPLAKLVFGNTETHTNLLFLLLRSPSPILAELLPILTQHPRFVEALAYQESYDLLTKVAPECITDTWLSSLDFSSLSTLKLLAVFLLNTKYKKEADLLVTKLLSLSRLPPCVNETGVKESLYMIALCANAEQLATHLLPHINYNYFGPNVFVSSPQGVVFNPILTAIGTGSMEQIELFQKQGADFDSTCIPRDSTIEKSFFEYIEERFRKNSAFVHHILTNAPIAWLKEYNTLLMLLEKKSVEEAQKLIDVALEAKKPPEWLKDKQRVTALAEYAIQADARAIFSAVSDAMEVTQNILLVLAEKSWLPELITCLSKASEREASNFLKGIRNTPLFYDLLASFPITQKNAFYLLEHAPTAAHFMQFLLHLFNAAPTPEWLFTSTNLACNTMDPPILTILQSPFLLENETQTTEFITALAKNYVKGSSRQPAFSSFVGAVIKKRWITATSTLMRERFTITHQLLEMRSAFTESELFEILKMMPITKTDNLDLLEELLDFELENLAKQYFLFLFNTFEQIETEKMVCFKLKTALLQKILGLKNWEKEIFVALDQGASLVQYDNPQMVSFLEKGPFLAHMDISMLQLFEQNYGEKSILKLCDTISFSRHSETAIHLYFAFEKLKSSHPQYLKRFLTRLTNRETLEALRHSVLISTIFSVGGFFELNRELTYQLVDYVDPTMTHGSITPLSVCACRNMPELLEKLLPISPLSAWFVSGDTSIVGNCRNEPALRRVMEKFIATLPIREETLPIIYHLIETDAFDLQIAQRMQDKRARQLFYDLVLADAKKKRPLQDQKLLFAAICFSLVESASLLEKEIIELIRLGADLFFVPHKSHPNVTLLEYLECSCSPNMMKNIMNALPLHSEKRVHRTLYLLLKQGKSLYAQLLFSRLTTASESPSWFKTKEGITSIFHAVVRGGDIQTALMLLKAIDPELRFTKTKENLTSLMLLCQQKDTARWGKLVNALLPLVQLSAIDVRGKSNFAYVREKYEDKVTCTIKNYSLVEDFVPLFLTLLRERAPQFASLLVHRIASSTSWLSNFVESVPLNTETATLLVLELQKQNKIEALQAFLTRIIRSINTVTEDHFKESLLLALLSFPQVRNLTLQLAVTGLKPNYNSILQRLHDFLTADEFTSMIQTISLENSENSLSLLTECNTLNSSKRLTYIDILVFRLRDPNSNPLWARSERTISLIFKSLMIMDYSAKALEMIDSVTTDLDSKPPALEIVASKPAETCWKAIVTKLLTKNFNPLADSSSSTNSIFASLYTKYPDVIRAFILSPQRTSSQMIAFVFAQLVRNKLNDLTLEFLDYIDASNASYTYAPIQVLIDTIALTDEMCIRTLLEYFLTKNKAENALRLYKRISPFLEENKLPQVQEILPQLARRFPEWKALLIMEKERGENLASVIPASSEHSGIISLSPEDRDESSYAKKEEKRDPIRATQTAQSSPRSQPSPLEGKEAKVREVPKLEEKSEFIFRTDNVKLRDLKGFMRDVHCSVQAGGSHWKVYDSNNNLVAPVLLAGGEHGDNAIVNEKYLKKLYAELHRRGINI